MFKTDKQTIDNPDRQLRNQASREPWRRTKNRPSQKILRVVDNNRTQLYKRLDNWNPSISFQFRTLDGFFCPSLSSKVYFSAGRISPNRGLATYGQPELAILLYQILACTSNATFWLKAGVSYQQVQKKKCGWIQNCGKCESHFGRHFPDVKKSQRGKKGS